MVPTISPKQFRWRVSTSYTDFLAERPVRDRAGMTLSLAAQGHRAAWGFKPALLPSALPPPKAAGAPMLEEPVNHSMTSGMPAANQTPPTFWIRSTGLSQEF